LELRIRVTEGGYSSSVGLMSGVRESVWRPDEHADAISCRITKAWLSDLRGDRPPHFEQSIDIDVWQQRVWEVLSDLEAWPQHIETVDVVELLTPAPVGEGSCVRLKQPKLPEGTWEVTVWDAPSYFEFRQKSGSVANVGGHRVEALEEGALA
jgi:uncharacterized membrane protein